MNELDLIKLNIYEAFDNGEITYGEKEYLLEQVDILMEKDEIVDGIDMDGEPYPIGARNINTDKLANKAPDNQHTSNTPSNNNTVVNNKQDNNIRNKIRQRANQARDRYNNSKFGQYMNTPIGKGKLTRGKAIGIGTGVGLGLAGISAGAVALKKKYDASVNGLLKKKSKLETKLKNTSDLKEKLAIMKEIKAIDAQVKALEKASDKQLKRAVKESTFDYLLESINDLYYED